MELGHHQCIARSISAAGGSEQRPRLLGNSLVSRRAEKKPLQGKHQGQEYDRKLVQSYFLQ